MPITVRSGGVARTATAVYAKVGGAWRSCVAVWVKSGGTWRKAFGGALFYSGALFDSEEGLSAFLTWNSSGSMTAGANATFPSTWVTPGGAGIGNGYYLKVVRTAGVAISYTGGLAAGVYGQLNVNKGISLAYFGPGARSAAGQWYISVTPDDSGIVASGNWDLITVPP